MNVLILEDEARTAKRLQQLLAECDPAIVVMGVLPSVEGTVAWLAQNTAPDLMLMDIHLEDDLVFRLFERTAITVPVIFVTAYDEYIVRAFKVNSIDYLLKPVQLPELKAALHKYNTLQKHFGKTSYDNLMDRLGMLQAYKERFMIALGQKMISVPTVDIAYFSLESRAVFITTREGQHLPLNYSLDTLSQLIDPKAFFRVNRQYIVSFGAIRNVHQYSAGKVKIDLAPPTREDVFVSGDRLSDFKTWLGK